MSGNGSTWWRPSSRPLGAGCVAGASVWGIVNVTPDSFSDGGLVVDVDAALQRAEQFGAAGADVIDVGGESTRPGAAPVSVAEELSRVLPIVQALASAGVAVSVDTSKAVVAEACLDAGAELINDVTAGADPAMFAVIAAAQCPMVLMHSRGDARTMDHLTGYDAVAQDVARELAKRVDSAIAAGVAADQLIVDPGFGFAKTAEQNWQLLSDLPEFVSPFASQGIPTLVGVSRKRFIAAVAPGSMAARDMATAAASLLAVQRGARAVRVHDVTATAAALQVLAHSGCCPLAQEEQ